MVMFMVFVGLTAFLSLYFLKHYFPYFKDADDLFSIAGFMFIYVVVTALIAMIVFTPYYLFIE
jgi:hypothetical protein